MFKKILVPTDGSELSEKAIDTAISLAKTLNAQVIGLAVAEPYLGPPAVDGTGLIDTKRYTEDMKMLAQTHVQRLKDAAGLHGLTSDGMVRVSSHPYEEIVKVAGEIGCDLIVMGSHGRKGLNALFVGSQTHKVLAATNIPTLVVR